MSDDDPANPTDDPSNEQPIVPHPLYEDIFPPMNDEERAELEESIKSDGLLDEIIINTKNQIIDGLNRYRACIAVGVTPRFKIMNLSDQEALAFMIKRNWIRRNMSETQRAATGARLGKSANLPMTQAQRAKAFKISTRTQGKADKVLEASPVLHRAMLDDKIAVDAASKIARLPSAERSKAEEEIKGGKKYRRKPKPAPVTGKIEMVDDQGRPLQGYYNKLLAVIKAMRHLPDELRGLRSFIGNDNHRLPPSGVVQLEEALTQLARTDFKDLVAAARTAIDDLKSLTAPVAEVALQQLDGIAGGAADPKTLTAIPDTAKARPANGTRKRNGRRDHDDEDVLSDVIDAVNATYGKSNS